MDATITPHYIHKRGNVMWENEFRYLTQAGTGLMELDYLPSDNVYKEHAKTSQVITVTADVLLASFPGVMDQVWRFNVDYTKVSDSSYFNDFDSKYGSSTDGYATQKFSVRLCGSELQCHGLDKQFRVF